MDGLFAKIQFLFISIFSSSVHFFSSVSCACGGEYNDTPVNGYDEWLWWGRWGKLTPHRYSRSQNENGHRGDFLHLIL
jgi:hypothetical protein